MHIRANVTELLARAQRLWRRAARKGPEVLVHDPAAGKPYDLDDPFSDPGVQEKVGKILAGKK